MSDAEPKASLRTVLTGNVLMLGLVSLFTDAASEMIYPLMPVFISGLVPMGAAAIYVGLLEGIAESTASLLKIYSGRLSDSLGKRKMLAVIGYGASTLCRPIMGFAAFGWHVIGLRFVDRIGKGVRTSPRDALISDSVDKENRGIAFSFHRAMDHFGAVIGSLLAMLILYLLLGSILWRESEAAPTQGEMEAMRTLFYISIIPGILAMAALIFWVKEIPPKKLEVNADANGDKQKLAPLPRRFYAYIGTVALFTLGNSSDLFLLFYAKSLLKLDLLQVILMWVVLHIAKVIFSIPGGMLSDKIGRRPLLVAGWLVYAFVYVSMAFVSTAPVFWSLIVLYGAYYGLTEGAEKALVADFVPSEHRGRAYGYFHGIVGLTVLPANLIFGLLFAKYGAPAAFGLGACLAGAATILLGFVLVKGKPVE